MLEARALDGVVVLVANLVNLSMTLIFLLRLGDSTRAQRTVGVAQMILGIPVLASVVNDLVGGASVWLVLLPLPLLAFLVVELVLDYILRLEFRKTWILGPYLGLYYIALFGLVGYSFLVDRTFGFATLGTYFVQLFASWYSLAKVGHGGRPQLA